jgi:hypothetical protein
MRVRSLVPALGLLATLAPVAFAADTPTVTPRGWVDAIATISDNDADGSETQADFTADGLLAAKWTVGAKVSGEVAIKASTEGDEDLVLAYADWAVTDKLTIRAGQSYGPLGYLAAEPTGLYTVNSSPVGIQPTFYGPAARGVTLTAKLDEKITGSFSIFDGSSADADFDLAYAADVVFTFDKGFVNVEGWYDVGAVDSVGSEEESVMALGANGEYKVSDPLKVGAELYYKSADEDTSLGLLVMANYALATETPMSVTGMVQYVQTDVDATDTTPSDLSLQAALLTNPTGSSNFGVNAEIGYLMSDADDGSDDVNSYWLAGEFLLSF